MLKQFKTVLLAFVVLAFLASCQTANNDARQQAKDGLTANAQPEVASPDDASIQPAVPTGPTTTMEFAETEFDFGTVQEGEKVRHTYKFKNTGKEPLVISDAKGSCGCTVPSKPTDPIAPGETGEIVVEFNTQGKAGQRNQKVTVTANTNPPQTFLSLKGVVAGATPQPQVNQ
ncbi:MAG: DUF1573 domain-containing protein [Saprospiraceae bacterium]